jgi:CelD/BcsL family acetyltransferase involved in cellulose biosynthesis
MPRKKRDKRVKKVSDFGGLDNVIIQRSKESREEIARMIRLQLATSQVRGESFDYLSSDPTARMISAVFLKNYEENGIECVDVHIGSKMDQTKCKVKQDIEYVVNLFNDPRKESSVKVSLGSTASPKASE